MFAVKAVSKNNMQCSQLAFNGEGNFEELGIATEFKLNVSVLRFSIFII